MNETLTPANIVLGDRTYRVKIEAKHEEHVRKTIKVINDKIVEFKTHFSGKDMQDYIAMVLIWYATQVHTNNEHAIHTSATTIILNKIEGLLDNAWQEKPPIPQNE